MKLWKWCISILVSVCSCDGIFILYSSSRYSTISWLEHHSYMWKDETLTKTYNFAFCWHLGNRDFLIFFCLQFNILDFKKFLAVEKDLRNRNASCGDKILSESFELSVSSDFIHRQLSGFCTNRRRVWIARDANYSFIWAPKWYCSSGIEFIFMMTT